MLVAGILARGELQRHYGISGLRSGVPGRTGILARGELKRITGNSGKAGYAGNPGKAGSAGNYGITEFRNFEVVFLAGPAFLPVVSCSGISEYPAATHPSGNTGGIRQGTTARDLVLKWPAKFKVSVVRHPK